MKLTHRKKFVSKVVLGLWALVVISCISKKKEATVNDKKAPVKVKIVGAMKNVMWNGELGSRLVLDTIAYKNNLYGLGPESYLTGEILINNGKSYVSRVISDSTMAVEKTFDVSAPFFVYTTVTEWEEFNLSPKIKTIQDLEKLIYEKTLDYGHPFAFRLNGHVSMAKIHIQNLPEGIMVSSPADAHQGQTNYELKNEGVEIVGFFSTEHKGVFTHHDSYVHMHLITKDEYKMGHLDELSIKKMKLYLPKVSTNP